jgi:hypothetical protein
LSAGGEQQVVEQTWVLQGQYVEFVRYSEDDMEVAGGQQFLFPRRQPAGTRCSCLTLICLDSCEI